MSALAGAAWADEPVGEAAGEPVGETIIVTASRTGIEAREIGSAITVVTAADIEAGQGAFARDVLQDVPGVQIASTRPGALASTSIRGSDADQVLFLVDGFELGDPSTISTQFQVEHMGAQDIAQIEVLRGNQSSLYGSDAIGGVVNIITQRARTEGLAVNGNAEYGSENTRSGGASLLGKYGPADFRVTASGFASDGPSANDPDTYPAETEDDEYRRWSLSGRGGYQISDTLEAQVMAFYNDAVNDLDDSFSPNSTDTAETKEYGAGAKLLHETADKRWRNELAVSRYDVERTYFGAYNAASGDVYDGVKDAAALTSSFRLSDAVGLAGGVNWETEETNQTSAYSALEADITTKSAFAEVALTPLEPLTVTLAARLDDNSRFGTFDTYRATAAWMFSGVLGGDLKLRGSYGTGAKAPGLYQLFDPTYGNPGLKVETSEGFDAGVDLYWNKAQVELTVFDTQISDEIGFDTARPPFGGYAQFAETSSKGAEFGARFELASWASVQQTLTVVDVQDGVSGKWRGRPRYAGATSLTVRPLDKLALTARARYRSDNASRAGRTVDGFVTVDLLASYEVTEQVEVYGRIVNAADEDHQMSYGANAPDQGVFAGLRFRS